MYLAADARPPRGLTLVEVLIAVAVIATAVGAIVGTFARNVQKSVDTSINAQAMKIASSYFDKIVGADFGAREPVTMESEGSSLDDIRDYDGLIEFVSIDERGSPVPDVTGFMVAVSVRQAGESPGAPEDDALRVDVRVMFEPFVDYTLSGFKTR